MAGGHLRVYHGPQDDVCASLPTAVSVKRCVTLPAGDVLPLLADAVSDHRTWLRDFGNDEVTISTDLYDVLLAYQHYRRPSA